MIIIIFLYREKKRNFENTSARFPDYAFDDAIKRIKINHVNMTRISGYCPKLLVPHLSGDTNSEHFNASSMYL